MPVTNLLSLSSKSTLHYLLYENRDGPCNISALQLAQCLAMMEKCAGGILKKEKAFLPSFCVYSSFLLLLHGCQQHLWGTLRGACGAQLHPVGSFPSNFRSTLIVRFPSSLGRLLNTSLQETIINQLEQIPKIKCAPLPITRKMHIKITMRYHLTLLVSYY